MTLRCCAMCLNCLRVNTVVAQIRKPLSFLTLENLDTSPSSPPDEDKTTMPTQQREKSMQEMRRRIFLFT